MVFRNSRMRRQQSPRVHSGTSSRHPVDGSVFLGGAELNPSSE